MLYLSQDIIAFDSCVVTLMNRFRDVYHYYRCSTLLYSALFNTKLSSVVFLPSPINYFVLVFFILFYFISFDFSFLLSFPFAIFYSLFILKSKFQKSNVSTFYFWDLIFFFPILFFKFPACFLQQKNASSKEKHGMIFYQI